MPITRCNKVKSALSYIFFLVAFVGMNGSVDATGHRLSLIESILLALLGSIIIKIMFSDWMYSYLIENGAKVNYKFYQYIAVYVWVLFVLVIFFASMSGHGYKIDIGLAETFLTAFAIYFIICHFGEKGDGL